jgi:hypothetical protein
LNEKGDYPGLKGGLARKLSNASISSHGLKWQENEKTEQPLSGSGATQKAHNLNKFYSVQEVLRLKPP